MDGIIAGGRTSNGTMKALLGLAQMQTKLSEDIRQLIVAIAAIGVGRGTKVGAAASTAGGGPAAVR